MRQLKPGVAKVLAASPGVVLAVGPEEVRVAAIRVLAVGRALVPAEPVKPGPVRFPLPTAALAAATPRKQTSAARTPVLEILPGVSLEGEAAVPELDLRQALFSRAHFNISHLVAEAAVAAAAAAQRRESVVPVAHRAGAARREARPVAASKEGWACLLGWRQSVLLWPC